MKRNKIVLSFIMSITLLLACNNQISNDESIVVNINKMQVVSMFDIFRKIEIIPLETNRDMLIRGIHKLRCADGLYFIYDGRQPVIFVFNENGKSVGKIQRQGNGPEEYYSISDFDIDRVNKRVTILSAVDGRMFEYDFQGNFIKQYSLPQLDKAAYMSFIYLNPDTIAFWTFDEEKRVKFYSVQENKHIYETFAEGNSIFNRFGNIFSTAHNFFLPSINHVYKITPSLSVVKALTWDFGNLNNDEKKLKKNHETYSKTDGRQVIEKIYASEIINYIFTQNGGNVNYNYAQLYRKRDFINIFNHKETGENLVFEQTSEKAKIFPIHWEDDYVIGFFPEIENSLESVIPDLILDNYNKGKKMTVAEFDNPILIKYYFRKRAII